MTQPTIKCGGFPIFVEHPQISFQVGYIPFCAHQIPLNPCCWWFIRPFNPIQSYDMFLAMFFFLIKLYKTPKIKQNQRILNPIYPYTIIYNHIQSYTYIYIYIYIYILYISSVYPMQLGFQVQVTIPRLFREEPHCLVAHVVGPRGDDVNGLTRRPIPASIYWKNRIRYISYIYILYIYIKR